METLRPVHADESTMLRGVLQAHAAKTERSLPELGAQWRALRDGEMIPLAGPELAHATTFLAAVNCQTFPCLSLANTSACSRAMEGRACRRAAMARLPRMPAHS